MVGTSVPRLPGLLYTEALMRLPGAPWALAAMVSLVLHGTVVVGAWRIEGLLAGPTLPAPPWLIADWITDPAAARPTGPAPFARDRIDGGSTVRPAPAGDAEELREAPATPVAEAPALTTVEPAEPESVAATPPPAGTVALIVPEALPAPDPAAAEAPSPPAADLSPAEAPPPPADPVVARAPSAPASDLAGAAEPAPPAAEPAVTSAAPVPRGDGADTEGAADATAAATPAPAVLPPPPALADLGRVREVTEAAVIASRAEAEPFVGRRDIFEFLLDHLEFATHVTRALRVARYKIWQTAEGLFLDDGWGALVQFSVLRATTGMRVIYARGEYQQTVLPSIQGEAVIMIEYEFRPAADGRDVVSAAVTNYVKFESAFMTLLARLANAAVTRKAETEARRLVRVFARVSRAVDENPAALFAALEDRPDVPRRELDAFRRLVFAR
jgi:hypothetical protein